MKVAINYRVQDGPWGGGNRFVANLTESLIARGDKVTTALGCSDIDVVVMIDPRWRNPATTFRPGDILDYVSRQNPGAIVIHRVNECDERKNTRGMNRRLKRVNYVADHTVFVAEWLRRDLPVWQDKTNENSTVILNGADPHTFNRHGQAIWLGQEPLKLVTHHWGGHWMKGFDVYERLDAMLAQPAWHGRISFTYIGNVPRGFTFNHATHIPPLDGKELADNLRGHHVYLTASINEPGSNHQNEGALCGLPVLYRESGALPEYCAGFGIGFQPESFETALEQMFQSYERLQPRMAQYPHTAETTTTAYRSLFEQLLDRRDLLSARRMLVRRPLARLAAHLPI